MRKLCKLGRRPALGGSPAHAMPAACLLALLVAITACSEPGPVSGPIAADVLAARLGSGTEPVLIDVRSVQEFESGHIPGAINIPHGQIAVRLADLHAAPGDELVVYCESGRRAAIALESLRAAGFTNTRALEGHMSAWRSSDLPCDGC